MSRQKSACGFYYRHIDFFHWHCIFPIFKMPHWGDFQVRGFLKKHHAPHRLLQENLDLLANGNITKC